MERVVLGWVDPGEVSGRFVDSILRWLYANGESYRIAGHIRLETGPRIAPARNTIVRQFLSDQQFKDVEWLLMIDADMTFPTNFIDEILRDTRTEEGKIKRPIVGGLYFGGGHGSIFPVMYQMCDAKLNNGNPVKSITDFKPGDIVEVDACGTGALLMHRGILEHLATLHDEPAPWFAESSYKPEGAPFAQEFGEDFTFCMRVRHQEIPIYVNTGAKAGHMKSVELNENTWRTGQIGLDSIAPPPPKLVERLVEPGPNREQRRRLERIK